MRRRHVKTEHGPQGPGETWAYEYHGQDLIVITVKECPEHHNEDGWYCVVLHGGHWEYEPGSVLDWSISDDEREWRRIQ